MAAKKKNGTSGCGHVWRRGQPSCEQCKNQLRMFPAAE
jgi:hypothetical protein